MSSDSEDDCYGNIAQRLQSLKNKYSDDKIETNNLLIAEVKKQTDNSWQKNDSLTSEKDCDLSQNSEEYTLDAIIARNSKKRASRSKRAADVCTDNILPPVTRKKMKTRKDARSDTTQNDGNITSADTSAINSTNNDSIVEETRSNRGRGRGKTRRGTQRGRGRGRQPVIPAQQPTIPARQPTIPAQQPTIPALQPTIPARQPSIPAQQPTIPARQPSIPGRQLSIPAQQHTIPARQPSIPAQQPTIPARQPSIPAQQPTIPARTPRSANTSRGRGRRTQTYARYSSYWEEAMNDPAMFDYAAALAASMVTTGPVFSVGNTDEYPDQSDDQPLFSNTSKPTNDVVTLEEEELDQNEELSVKVYWQNMEHVKFSIRRFQKLSPIFDHFAERENVSRDKLFFTYNDRILKCEDTPDTISYSIVKFIDGGIINQSVSSIIKNNGMDEGIKLKFQCQNVKKPFVLSIQPKDKMSVVMMKCAEHLEKPLEKLKFHFDGDLISGKQTAEDLDLEGGECIDVRIIS